MKVNIALPSFASLPVASVKGIFAKKSVYVQINLNDKIRKSGPFVLPWHIIALILHSCELLRLCVF